MMVVKFSITMDDVDWISMCKIYVKFQEILALSLVFL